MTAITAPIPYRHQTPPVSTQRSVPKRWRYAGGKRDLRLDLLRGFAAFAMIADHASQASWLAYLTGADGFFVSAAEPFVFISGLVLGMVYRPIFESRGLFACVKKALGRASTLYVVTVALGLTFIALSSLSGAWWGPDRASLTWDYAWRVATFRQTFFLVDIPMLYTLLLLLAVPALIMLSRGLALPVLILSWGAWLIWQQAPGAMQVPWAIEGNTTFAVTAWQVLFFTALTIGWHRPELERWFSHVPAKVCTAVLLVLPVYAVALYAMQYVLIPQMHEGALASYDVLNKPLVPISRLLAFAVFMGGAFALLTLAWRPLNALVGWLLLPLGQNALTAYGLHLFTSLGAALYFGRDGAENMPTAVVLAVQTFCVLSVWLIVVGLPLLQDRPAHRPQRVPAATSPHGMRYAA